MPGANVMHERRASPRHEPRHTVTVRILQAGSDHSEGAVLVNVSAGGVRLFTPYRLPPGRFVLLNLPGADRMMARVRYASRGLGGAWFCGCELVGALSKA